MLFKEPGSENRGYQPKPEDVKADPTSKDIKVVEKKILKREDPKPKLYKTHWVWHTVEKGQTLWQLYKLYNCPVDVIKKLNDLSSNDLKIGQKLKIMAREEIIEP